MDGLPPQFPPRPQPPLNSGVNSTSGTRDIIWNLLVIIVLYLACLLIITYMYCIQRREGEVDDHQTGRYIWGNLSILSGTRMYGSQGKRLVNEDCLIYLANFENGEECKVRSECRHVYHKECIDEWIWRDGHCPHCRVYARVIRRVVRDLELGVLPFP